MMNHRYKPTSRFEAAGRKILARRTTRDAILGDEHGFVDVPGELGYHWARFAASADVNNNATFGPAFRVMANPGAGYSPTVGRRVKLKLTDEGWKVEEGSFQDMVQAGIDPRALNPNDPYSKFPYLDELVDASSRGIASGLKVQVQGWKYNTADNVFKIDIGTNASTHVDLASSVPSAGNHRYAVLVFNVTEDIAGNDPWQVYDSTAIATTTALDEANIQTAYDLFPTNELIVPIKAYYLAAGQTTIKGPRYDVDLRTAWNIPGVIDGQVTIPKLSPFALKITPDSPTVDDDVSLGYVVGSRWIDTVTDKEYVLTDSTNGAAVWTETTGGGGSVTLTSPEGTIDIATYAIDVADGAIDESKLSADSVTETKIPDSSIPLYKFAPGQGSMGGPGGSVIGYDGNGNAAEVPNAVDIPVIWGENVSDLDNVYLKADDKWWKEDADAGLTGPMRGVGIAASGTTVANNPGVVRIYGRADGYTGLSNGDPMYLSNTPGGYTQTRPTPSLGGSTVLIVQSGYALSADTAFVDLRLPMQYQRRASLADGDTLTLTHHADTSFTRKLSAAISATDTVLLETSGGTQDSAQPLRGLSGAGSVNVVDAAGAANVALGDSGGTDYRVAQSWQASAAGRVSSITFRAGATTGTPSALPSWSIEADDGTGKPSGVALAGGTMVSWNASADNTITVTDGPFQDTGVTLWFVLQLPIQATNNNYVVIRNATGAYASGVMKWDSTTGASFPGTWGLGGGTNDMRVSITVAAVAANDAIGQGFSHSSTTTVNYADILLKKTGLPTGNLTLAIYSNTAGLPNAVITNGTATVVAASTLTTGYTLIRFTWSTPPTITASTQYHLVLTTADSASNTNYVEWGTDASSPSYANGALALLQSASWAAASPAADGIFNLYGVGSTFGSTCVPGLWISVQSDIVARNDDGAGANSATNTTFKNTSGVTLDVTCIVEMP